MRLLKDNIILRLLNSYMVDSPQPANITYLWNFGSLLGICLVLQILTGCFLAMHFTPHAEMAFNSVEHIMRDVQSGWIVRYTHANVASFFFIFVYAQLKYIKIILHNLQLKDWIFSNGTETLIKNNLYSIQFFLLNAIVLIKKIIDEFLNIKDKTLLNKSKYSGLEDNLELESDFLQWFVGFSDAESSFMISLKNNSPSTSLPPKGVGEAHFIFRITLHIDDCAVLFTIRERLGIGVVSIRNQTCTYSVHSFQNIINVLLPIFDKYPLLTLKQLDYSDWRKAIILKKENKDQSSKISLSLTTFNQISHIKNNMNTNRTDYQNYKLKKEMISKYWLVGFVEGDGSFFFTNGNAVFSLTQKDKRILEVIRDYLENIPLNPPYKGLVKPSRGKPHCSITRKNKNTAYQLDIQDKDVLFQYILPFFKNLQFFSRKGIDFSIWCLGLHILINGYNHLFKGKELLLKLSNNMNSKRYFSDISELLDIQDLKELFDTQPPFDIYSGKSHFVLAKEFHAKKGSRRGYKVYVYKNGIQIKESPFHSYRDCCKVLDVISPSSIKNYIDSGKPYKEYQFYSTLQIFS